MQCGGGESVGGGGVAEGGAPLPSLPRDQNNPGGGIAISSIKHLLNSTTSTQYWAPCQYTHKHSLLLFTVQYTQYRAPCHYTHKHSLLLFTAQYTVYTLYYGEGKISVCDAFYYAVDNSKYLFSLISTKITVVILFCIVGII